MSIVDYKPVRNTDPKTSHEAARKLQHRRSLQRMVLQVFYQMGHRGATNEDVYAGWPRYREDVLRPRVAELRNRSLIVLAGSKMGSRRRHISIWRITPAGIAWLESFER